MRGSLVTMDDARGSADDLMLRAVRALQCADVIVHDHGVSAEVLRLARREAERVPADEASGRNDALRAARSVLAALTAGRRVVRLWSPATPPALRAAELSCFWKFDIVTACLQNSGHGQPAAGLGKATADATEPSKRRRSKKPGPTARRLRLYRPRRAHAGGVGRVRPSRRPPVPVPEEIRPDG
ncbi:MAG: hypothetical protein IPK78_18710 [Rhodospirillales bacterium]|nr:hypothetical protein [Rhodospirillales bacterium]